MLICKIVKVPSTQAQACVQLYTGKCLATQECKSQILFPLYFKSKSDLIDLVHCVGEWQNSLAQVQNHSALGYWTWHFLHAVYCKYPCVFDTCTLWDREHTFIFDLSFPICYCNTHLMFLQELSSREDELRQIQMAQEVHAESLKKREEELAQREMLLLGREISMLIQVRVWPHCYTYHFSPDNIKFSKVTVKLQAHIKHIVTAFILEVLICSGDFEYYNFISWVSCLYHISVSMLFLVATKAAETFPQKAERTFFQAEVWEWKKD